MTLRVAAVEIRQELDEVRLDGLSEEAREAADEEGYLDGNQHYQDLGAASWDDVRYALNREADLIRDFAKADDPAAAECALRDSRDPDDEREGLWGLDAGMAAPLMALNALGSHTVLSCNGGAFGGHHPSDRPCVRFYLASLRPSLLLQLARDADVGVIEEEGRVLLYGRSVLDLQRFAALALERGGTPQPP